MSLPMDVLFMISDAMKKRLCFLLCILLFCIAEVSSQEVFRYRKSSLYSIMLKHENLEFCEELVNCFNKIPIPEKFNDHNLPIRVFKAGVQEIEKGKNASNQKTYIDELLKQNAIARRLVAKWYNRSKDGAFNLDLITERGYCNVLADDVAKQKHTFDTQSDLILSTGEELIGHTYVLVNDIEYVDKRAKKEEQMSVAIAVGSAVPVVGMMTLGAAGILAHEYSGFEVNVTSYLYRLCWDTDVQNAFYVHYYTEKADQAKKTAFNKEKELFSLEYVGCQTVQSQNTNLKGIDDREQQIRKVCTRAVDKSIALLQKKHPEFRVRTPLASVSPITAKIGLREDVTESSLYEVLEVIPQSDGHIAYKRVATIRPKKNVIWDNRYLAEFEDDYNNSIQATEFELVSGSIPYAGLLIREIDVD